MTTARRRALDALFRSAVLWGLAAGSVTGAVTATALLVPYIGPYAVEASVPGALVGFIVSLPLALIVASAVTVLAARRHSPLVDPAGLHRDMWSIFVVTVVVLDGPVVGFAAAGSSLTVILYAFFVTSVATEALLLMMRRAAPRIVVAYARGWGLSLDGFVAGVGAGRRSGRAAPRSSRLCRRPTKTHSA